LCGLPFCGIIHYSKVVWKENLSDMHMEKREKGEISLETRGYKKWNCIAVGGVILILLIIIAVTIYIDPFFHYHGPMDGIAYELNIDNSRHQNDGIIKHFEYDAVIAGNSMAMNFKNSLLDELFGTKSIKVADHGARYKETNETLEKAFRKNPDIKLVLRVLDLSMLIFDKDDMRGGIDYPVYMTNDKVLDDVYYLLNKDVFLKDTLDAVLTTLSGGETTSFDEYGRFHEYFTFGKDSVLRSYTLGEKQETKHLTEEDKRIIYENLEQNVLALVREHPDTEFYLYFPPYSIGYWDELNQNGEIERMIDAEQYAIELLLKQPNIKLYCFFTNFDMVCDLDNYTDYQHYGEWINDDMLRWMRAGEYLLTEENYMTHLDSMRDFYMTFAYESLHE